MKAQDEEEKWTTLQMFLIREIDKLTNGQVNYARKIETYFLLSKDGILYYLGRRHDSRELLDEDFKVLLEIHLL